MGLGRPAVSGVKGRPITVPTNIAMAITTSGVAIGNGLNRLDHAVPTKVATRIGSNFIVCAQTDSDHRRGDLRNLDHALYTGVVRNMAGNCGGRLDVRNANFGTILRNGGLLLDLNFTSTGRCRLPRNVGTAINGSNMLIAIRNVGGRIMNLTTTHVHDCCPTRPCGNGNIGCINRGVHHGRNGGVTWDHLGKPFGE